MKKIPKNLHDAFLMFLTVIGFKAKMNPDTPLTCINPKMPKGRRQIVFWQDGRMNKSCQLVWFEFLNHWLLIGKEFIEKLSEKVEVA